VDGLRITALPAAIAGAVFCAACASGRLNARIDDHHAQRLARPEPEPRRAVGERFGRELRRAGMVARLRRQLEHHRRALDLDARFANQFARLLGQQRRQCAPLLADELGDMSQDGGALAQRHLAHLFCAVAGKRDRLVYMRCAPTRHMIHWLARVGVQHLQPLVRADQMPADQHLLHA
jgi:hypothetical protein